MSVPATPSTRRAAWTAARITPWVSGRSGVSQNQPQLANIARRQRWAAMSVRKVVRAAIGAPPESRSGSHRSANASAVSAPMTTST